MELGTLLVKLSAKTTGFSSQMSAGAKSLEDFAKGAKKISGDLGQAGIAVTAFGGAMTALAATVDGGAKKSLDDMHAASASLAVQIADVLKPAMDELSSTLKKAADFVANLSPETKKLVADFAVVAVTVGIAGMALQKLFGVIAALSGAWAAFSVAMANPAFVAAAALAGAFALALVGVAVAAAVVVDNWDLFANGFAKAVHFMKGIWRDFMDGLSTMWSATINLLAKGLEKMGLNDWAAKMRNALKPGDLLAQLGDLAKYVADAGGDAVNATMASVKRGWAIMMKEMGLDGTGGSAGPGARLPSIAAAAGKANPDAYDYSSGLAEEMARDEKFRQQERDSEATPNSPQEKPEQKTIAKAAATVDVAGTVINAVTSKLGELGGVINSIVQGAQAGGVWGAIVAAIMEIVSRMKGFTEVLDGAMQLIYDIAGALEPILTPIFNFLKDVFADLGQIFKDMTPIWKALGEVVNFLLAPLRWLVGALKWWMNGGSDTTPEQRAKDAFTKYGAASDKDKAEADRQLSALTGQTVEQSHALNTQLTETYAAAEATTNFANIMRQASDATQSEAKDFMDRWRATYGTATAEELAKKMGLSDEATKFAVAQYNAMAEAAGEGAKKLGDLNEQLSDAMQNVPKGVKLALARFNSQDGVMPGSTAQEAPYSIGPVYVNAASGKQLWDELVGVAAGEANLKMGTSAPMLRALKGF